MVIPQTASSEKWYWFQKTNNYKFRNNDLKGNLIYKVILKKVRSNDLLEKNKLFSYGRVTGIPYINLITPIFTNDYYCSVFNAFFCMSFVGLIEGWAENRKQSISFLQKSRRVIYNTASYGVFGAIIIPIIIVGGNYLANSKQEISGSK